MIFVVSSAMTGFKKLFPLFTEIKNFGKNFGNVFFLAIVSYEAAYVLQLGIAPFIIP
jgi:hypothetical protein